MRSLLFFLSVTLTFTLRANGEEQVIGLLGSKANYEILRQAERIEACPLIIDWEASGKNGKAIIASEGPYLALTGGDTALLKAKLLASNSYKWGNEVKDCVPDYHLRIRAYHRGDRVDVDFCFGCDILQFHRGTEVFGQKDFDPASKGLFSVFLRLFPNDPTMRLLKERREAWEKKRNDLGKVATSAPNLCSDLKLLCEDRIEIAPSP